MSREWNVKCKRCRKPMGYSDRSYRHSLQYGHSRPEYCEDCQREHRQEKAQMGAPYFGLRPEQEAISDMSMVYHPSREHQVEDKPSHFDETLYGLTQEKIRQIADWFSDPTHRVVVVVGPTGSGKSTALPYWLVNPPEGIAHDYFTRDGQILVTQPRIVATTGITKYLGTELLGSSIGAGFDIGYTYSRHRRSDWRNVVAFCTDGILINEIVKGHLNRYGLIIIDEAHERSLNIDQILRLIKDRMGLYPNLKLVIASATIDAEFFRDFFGPEMATIIEIEGKQRVDKDGNPVSYEVFFADEEEALPYSKEDMLPLGKQIVRAVVNKTMWLITEIVEGHKELGDILVFLQGVAPIDKAVEQLTSKVKRNKKLAKVVEVYPLYRALSEAEKDKVLDEEPEPGKLRVVVSTNIAEASLTVDGVVYEIETGVENQPTFNPNTGVTKVPLTLISKANAKQRWGRTGRTRNGEVYCLYTKKQFETLFPEYPVAEIQRSSMEEIVLTTKAAGITHINDGWLENPSIEEINRSIQTLQEYEALSADGSLTQRGLMLRSFSYPIKLIDLILLADDWGCAVEVATLLPIIKNGGQRRLLKWQYSWDAYTKQEARQKHLALMAGCLDDVEFILKLYKAWDELPWLSHKQLQDLSEAELETVQTQWAQVNFVDHAVLQDEIKVERDEVLQRLFGHRKDNRYRSINFDLIDRVRLLLSVALPEVTLTHSVEGYEFNTRVEPDEGSVVTCQVFFDPTWQETTTQAVDQLEWLMQSRFTPIADVGDNSAARSQNVFSRLFVDQVYPVGCRFEAKVVEVQDGHAFICTTKKLTQALALHEELGLEDEEDELSELEDEDEGLEEKEAKKTEVEIVEMPTVSLNDMIVRYKRIHCLQTVEVARPLAEDETLTVEVTGYNFDDLSQPVVLTQVVPQPEPFDIFAKSFRYSDEVEVKVVGILQYPNDYRAALVVCEPNSGLEMLVEPENISFTRSSFVVTQIPEETTLKMTVEDINQETRRVRLSLLPVTEAKINDKFLVSGGSDEPAMVSAQVIEVRNDEKVILALDWGEPESGFGVVVGAYGKKLPMEACEFAVGQSYLLKVYRRTRTTYHTSLNRLPEKAQFFIGSDDADSKLAWSNGTLRYTGRMTYDDLFECKTYADDPTFHRALDRLYWLSNSLFVDQFLDSEWFESVEERFPVGSIVTDCTITSASEYGVVVTVADEVPGFIPRSKILWGVSDASTVLSVGDTVDVKVLELRPDKRELLLDLVNAQDPLDQFIPDEKHRGVVTGIQEYGIFVELAPTVQGLVHISKMFCGRHKPKELFEIGQEVLVEVLAIDRGKRELELSTKIPENDPYNTFSIGDVVTGTIINIKKFGIFVELAPGLDGLIPRRFLRTTPSLELLDVGLSIRVQVYDKVDSGRKLTLKVE